MVFIFISPLAQYALESMFFKKTRPGNTCFRGDNFIIAVPPELIAEKATLSFKVPINPAPR